MGWFWSPEQANDTTTRPQHTTLGGGGQGENLAEGQDEEILKLDASIKKAQGEIAQSKRQGAILQRHRSNELNTVQKKYQVHADHWLAVKRAMIDNKSTMMYSPDYSAVIKKVFAEYQKDNPTDDPNDYDRSKQLTWFCNEEVKLCRAMHYETVSEKLLPVLTDQYHELKRWLKASVLQLQEEHGLVGSIHLSAMDNSHKKQQALRETYENYIEIQEQIIAALRQQRQDEEDAAATTSDVTTSDSDPPMSQTSAKQRVAENRRKREEFLKQETAKRRARHDEDDRTTENNVRSSSPVPPSRRRGGVGALSPARRAGRGLSSSRARANSRGSEDENEAHNSSTSPSGDETNVEAKSGVLEGDDNGSNEPNEDANADSTNDSPKATMTTTTTTTTTAPRGRARRELGVRRTKAASGSQSPPPVTDDKESVQASASSPNKPESGDEEGEENKSSDAKVDRPTSRSTAGLSPVRRTVRARGGTGSHTTSPRRPNGVRQTSPYRGRRAVGKDGATPTNSNSSAPEAD